jgi:RNA polymerase sigma factor (sigma-70 family)
VIATPLPGRPVPDVRSGNMPALSSSCRHRKGYRGVRPKRADDEHSFEAFFRAAFPKTVAVARRVTGEHGAAEDAAIEAMAKAHLRWQRIGPAPWRERWVLRVAVNEAIRRLPRVTAGTRDDVASDHAWPGQERSIEGSGRAGGGRTAGQPTEGSDPAEEIVLRQALTAALRRLPRRQREVVVLRYLVGLSEAQVAETLDISHGTVKTHLRRGLAGLRKDIDLDLKEEHLASLA